MWKMFRKNLVPKRKGGEIRLRPEKLYQRRGVVGLMRKRSLYLHGRLLRMCKDKLTKRIFDLFRLRKTVVILF